MPKSERHDRSRSAFEGEGRNARATGGAWLPGDFLRAEIRQLETAASRQRASTVPLLGDKLHDGDRRIAATAIRLGGPLASHDRLFNGARGLRLITADTAR
jgi:predicted nucleic acid-binding protein